MISPLSAAVTYQKLVGVCRVLVQTVPIPGQHISTFCHAPLVSYPDLPGQRVRVEVCVCGEE